MVDLLDSMPHRHVPPQKPGHSKQDYATPDNFMQAIVKRFGPVDFDLAASPEDRKAVRYFSAEDDALTTDWHTISARMLWLNPPFGKLAPWAVKCSDYTGGGRVYMLAPAAVGARWFAKHVFGRARVIFLAPRLSFDGAHPYPKDCMLCVFGKGVRPGFEFWDWSTDTRTKL